MSHSEVTNDVLCERIGGLATLIEEKFKNNSSEHERIEEQVTKTNGRVTSLEGVTDSMEKWQNRVIGGWIITAILVIPILIFLVEEYIRQK
jgi:hypothetical protein